MVIERITGGKPQEVRKAEQSATESKRDVSSSKDRPAADKPSVSNSSATTNVSEKSMAAIKAYRIAAESKPDISRAQRVAKIKSEMANGTYIQPASSEVANAILKDIVKGS